MTDSINPIWPVLLGGSLSLAGSCGATWWAKHLERLHLERQLARAIKGELLAMTHISNARAYTTGLRNAVQQMQATNQAVLFYATVAEDFARVFKANADKIGLLKGSLPADIAITYSLISSVVVDLNDMGELVKNPEMPGQRDADSLIRKYQAMIDLTDDAMERAATIIKKIERLYP